MDSSPIKWLSPIEDIPKRAIDPLADELMRRFNAAVAHQNGELVNGKPLRTVLQECWEQQNGVLSCDDKERMDALGVDATVNLTALKTGIANAYLNDSMVSGDATLPWVIMPTPRPTLSPESRSQILKELRTTLGIGDTLPPGLTPEMLVTLTRALKSEFKRREEEAAEKSAHEMMMLIEDQCAEGGFTRALSDFLHYFTVYPYAVFTGPYIVRAPRLIWGKNKPRLATDVFPTFRAVSPFDFAYSPDSPDTQRGTCVFTRTLWTRKELLDCAKLPSYIRSNVLDILEQSDVNPDFDLNWLSRSPDDPARDLDLWASNVALIEVLTHYGLLSGRELRKYGFNNLDDLEFYNCEIAMAGYRIIRVQVMSDPKMSTRPVYTASFYRTGGDRIAGDGIAQRIRDVERAYHACLGYLMRNAANASAPLCEADYKRISEFLTDDDLGNVVPGMMYMVNSDLGSSNNPALRFFNVPSNIPAYAQLMEMFMQLADRVTNIPASLHGEAVGSGAMRTFRGMNLLQGNATKALHASVDNIVHGVFNPLGEKLYNTNMLYAEDPLIKGDSHIMTKGSEGLLQKEIEKQGAMEILQLIGAVGAQLGGMINIGPVVGWGIKKLVGAMGVPDDVIKAMESVPPQASMPNQQESAPKQNPSNPNPNPNPGPTPVSEQ